MQIREGNFRRQPSIKTYSMQKSQSAAAMIIYGDKNSNDYADSLMNFKKDFATLDSERRQKEAQRKNASLERRKESNLIREIQSKQNQQQTRLKWLQRQSKSQCLYGKGQLRNTLVTSLPINPISSEYQKNEPGHNLAIKDEEKGLNRMVRAHYLHTLGNSGYNIINGRSSMDFDRIVPNEKHEAFERKINQLYSRFRLNPEGH